jgi:toxin ParE1/3/4
MSGYRLSKHADRDFAEILHYTIRTWGKEQETYFKLLTEAMNQIVKNPMLSSSKNRPDLAEGCRVLRVGRHMIFYRVNRNIIEVARILHESMDFSQHIGEETFPQ